MLLSHGVRMFYVFADQAKGRSLYASAHSANDRENKTKMNIISSYTKKESQIQLYTKMNIRCSYTLKWISDPAIHERTEDHITDSQSEDAIERKLTGMKNHSRCACHIQSFTMNHTEILNLNQIFHRNVSLSFAGNQNEYHRRKSRQKWISDPTPFDQLH